MDFFTWLIDAVPCSTAEAWLCACSATCSTEEVSSSTEALVSSRLEAWLCAPSASFWALAEISSLEEAIWTAFSCTIATMSFSFTDMPFNALARIPVSSFCMMSSFWVKSPLATSWAKSTPLVSGLVMEREIRICKTTTRATNIAKRMKAVLIMLVNPCERISGILGQVPIQRAHETRKISSDLGSDAFPRSLVLNVLGRKFTRLVYCRH